MTSEPDLPATLRIDANFRIDTNYRTRDRREARIERIDSSAGLIFGQVQMHGPCAWQIDGRYRDAPFGVPGPLDLMAPGASKAAPAAPKSVSIKQALED